MRIELLLTIPLKLPFFPYIKNMHDFLKFQIFHSYHVTNSESRYLHAQFCQFL